MVLENFVNCTVDMADIKAIMEQTALGDMAHTFMHIGLYGGYSLYSIEKSVVSENEDYLGTYFECYVIPVGPVPKKVMSKTTGIIMDFSDALSVGDISSPVMGHSYRACFEELYKALTVPAEGLGDGEEAFKVRQGLAIDEMDREEEGDGRVAVFIKEHTIEKGIMDDAVDIFDSIMNLIRAYNGYVIVERASCVSAGLLPERVDGVLSDEYAVVIGL